MEVLGHDSAREAYRVAVTGRHGRLVGVVPDAVIASGLRLTGGHGHQTAYSWLARHAHEIELTLNALSEGRRPFRAPFDRMELEGET